MNLDHNSGHWTQKISSFPFIYSFHWLIIVHYKPFLFKNLLWASSKASEACKERAWQPGREQLVFTCLQNQSSGNTYFGGLPNNHLSFSFALCPGLHTLTHTGFLMYFDFPCCELPSNGFVHFSTRQQLNNCFVLEKWCRSRVLPCHCWGCSGSNISRLVWKDQKAAYSLWSLWVWCSPSWETTPLSTSPAQTKHPWCCLWSMEDSLILFQ